jgi:hypothetical protein
MNYFRLFSPVFWYCTADGRELDAKRSTPSPSRSSQNSTERISKEAKAQKPEQPPAVLTAPLDRDQVRVFAECQGVQQLDEFMSALDRDNLCCNGRK